MSFLTFAFRRLVLLVAVFVGLCSLTSAQDKVFSGPQVGEALPPFTMRTILGPNAGKEVDPVTSADGQPVLLIFVHKRERPAFGLANLLTRVAVTRESQGLQRSLIFLTDDATTAESWLKGIPQHFEKGTPVGLSTDGTEGPGALGLNRNVTLTVLTGKDGKVTGNFALVQPSIAADGPEILKSIVETTGGGEVPDIAKFLPQGMRDRMQPKARDSKTAEDGKLRELLRAVIRKDATPEDVSKAAKAVDKYVAENRQARAELKQIAGRVVGSPKFADYGTAAAREQLKSWAKPKPQADDESAKPESSSDATDKQPSEGS